MNGHKGAAYTEVKFQKKELDILCLTLSFDMSLKIAREPSK